jgi:hypothetical protein
MSAPGDVGGDARGTPDGYGFPLPPLSEEDQLARKVRCLCARRRARLQCAPLAHI